MSDETTIGRNADPLQIVLDNTMAMVYVCDVDTYEIIFANKALKSNIPYEIEGQKCWKVLSKFDGPCPYCKLHTVLAKPLGETFMWENYNADFQWWLQMSDSIVKWTDGRKVHLITLTDITDVKNNEVKLKEYKVKLEKLLEDKTESEQRLKSMSDNMPHSFAFQLQRVPGESSKLLYISKGVEAICGVTIEELGLNVNLLWSLMHPEDLARLMSATETNKPFNLEVRFNRPDTQELAWIELAEIPRVNNVGEIVWDGIAMDITLRKKMEAELKLSQEELLRKAQQVNDISNNMVNSGIYRTHLDENGKICLDYASNNIIELLGFTFPQLQENMGIFIDMIHPDDKEEVIPRIVGSTGSLGEVTSEFRYLKDGKLYWLRIQSQGFVEDGHVYRDGIMIDITEQKQLEAQLIEARNRAEESDKLKSTFMANMSHEIRTPMNAIVGFLDILCQDEEDTIDSDTRKEFMNIVTNNANQLLQLIGDLLDISKIDAGQMKISPEKGDLNVLMRNIYLSFSASKVLVQKPAVKFVMDEGGQVAESTFMLDFIRLRQILDNLIGNAIKFTDSGHVRYGYNVTPEGLRFFVEDTGIGIAEEKLSELGKAFSQLHDPSTASKYGGTGIGVAISKNLVKLMGGTFHVESELGKGTRFVFMIPTATH